MHGLVHGDYRISNLVFTRTSPESTTTAWDRLAQASGNGGGGGDDEEMFKSIQVSIAQRHLANVVEAKAPSQRVVASCVAVNDEVVAARSSSPISEK